MGVVTIYSPDSHLLYDRATLDKQGIGGGATTRVRMAYALAERGHKVRLYINCPQERSENGVETRHFSTLRDERTDIFIATTSGGGLDLSMLNLLDFDRSLKILLVHGINQPKGMEQLSFDYVYAPSNFIRRIVVSDWGVPSEKLFVTHRGIWEENFRITGNKEERDPFALVYAGYPSKGLEPAIAVWRILHTLDARFGLNVFGGFKLWGENERLIIDPEISYNGILGQVELAYRLHNCSFSLHLQNRQEPFGMAVIEAMRAGCIVLASPVGAYPEIIEDGWNGFLISGDPVSPRTHEQTASLILEILENPARVEMIRKNARRTPLTCSQVAKTWEGHWNWHLYGEMSNYSLASDRCNKCRGDCLSLADGLHCVQCGNYQKIHH